MASHNPFASRGQRATLGLCLPSGTRGVRAGKFLPVASSDLLSPKTGSRDSWFPHKQFKLTNKAREGLMLNVNLLSTFRERFKGQA